MRNLTRCFGLMACMAAACLQSGCNSECKKGASECISSSLIRTCVPAESGNEWLVSQCRTNEACERSSNTVARGADAGANPNDAGAPSQSQAACVGTCQVGEHECVSDSLARYCVSGGAWELDACQVGEKCDKGECKLGLGKGSVQTCVPGAKACASDKVEKVCDPDGTGWVENACLPNETCTQNACVPDPRSSCDDPSVCFDNKTAIRCLGQAEGFALVPCEDDLFCEGGRCRGAVCALGSACLASNQVRECVGGKSYKDTQCGVNEVCQSDKDKAQCVPLQCTPGTSACGDPRDSAVDPKKYFSTCTTGVGSGIPEWVRGECTGAMTCNPALLGTGNPCSQNCTKGAQRCTSDPLSGINDGIQVCDDQGKWGAIKSCNPGNEGRLQCVVPASLDPKKLPVAICAAPVCFWALVNPNVGATGTCEGDALRKCQADGTLGAAAACESGICHTVRSTTTADGRMPGACDVTPECQDGEQLCASMTGAVTPRFRTCKHGAFGSELMTCPDDGACYNSKDDKGLRHALCGASCSPGNRRCNSSGQLEACDAQGKWLAGKACAAGSCKAVANNDAACVLDCVPGTKLCGGAPVTAPDGYHAGTAQEIVCSAEGLRGVAAACETGKVCRVTESGVALGCVACIGAGAPGGNDEGVTDSRCDPDDAKKLQECGDDNAWQSGRMCSGSKSCKSPSSGTCGTCMGAHSTFTCTQTNISSEQMCGGCSVALTGGGSMTLQVCSESAMTNAGASPATCAGQNRGTASSWGGVADCCSLTQTTAAAHHGASCVSLSYGAPSGWANVADCCGNYQLGAGGAASFAYCD